MKSWGKFISLSIKEKSEWLPVDLTKFHVHYVKLSRWPADILVWCSAVETLSIALWNCPSSFLTRPRVPMGTGPNLLSFSSVRSEPFTKAERGTCWGHHFTFLKASWLRSKSAGINVINNYGPPCPTSRYLSFPDVLRLASLARVFPSPKCLNRQWPPRGWDRQEPKGILLVKYIFGWPFCVGGREGRRGGVDRTPRKQVD